MYRRTSKYVKTNAERLEGRSSKLCNTLHLTATHVCTERKNERHLISKRDMRRIHTHKHKHTLTRSLTLIHTPTQVKSALAYAMLMVIVGGVGLACVKEGKGVDINMMAFGM